MYESFYGLKEKPFSMLPDPGFLYLSKKHQMALTLLEYGLLNHVGFCVVSGETGSGKTTLLRKLLENIQDDVTVGMITNTHKGFGELLDWVLSAYNIHEQGMSTVDMHQRFMDFLVEQYAANKSTLLIVDEAQNMTAEKLEELRMLSNVNSEKDQVLQVILAGQPDLKQTLQLPELKQFAQRIGVDHHLGSLDEEETYGYINHRLSVAGATREIFTEEACDQIYEYSGGIPRLINLLCDTVMVYGFADQRETIDDELVDEMVQERMKDSIVPLASKSPSSKENKPRKKKSIQSPFAQQPAEEVKEGAAVESSNKATSEPARVQIEDTVVPVENEEASSVEQEEHNDDGEVVDTIEQMVSESVTFGRRADDQLSDDEPAETSSGIEDVKLHEPNTIQVLEPEEPPETKKWVWFAAAAVLVVVSVVVIMVGTSDPDMPLSERVTPGASQPAPVVQEVSDNIKRQLEEAERFRKELTRRQEEDRARMKALEEQAALLQRERDEALAKATAERKKREHEAELAKAAAKNKKEAQEAAERAKAAAMEAERKAKELEQLRAEEAARIERELQTQKAKLEAERQAVLKAIEEAKPEPVVEVEKQEKTFNTDPCASSTARFLSTCR